MQYRIVRSNRKTLGLQVGADGVTVRAPRHTSEEVIRQFVASHADWIEKSSKKFLPADQVIPLSTEDLRSLADRALKIIPPRVKYYASVLGVTYGRITVRNQRTKWGSCSSEGNLNFNCLLMLAPTDVLDYIIVHELCHRKEMNHSKRFYAEVARVLPNYQSANRWLREKGPSLMQRMLRGL